MSDYGYEELGWFFYEFFYSINFIYHLRKKSNLSRNSLVLNVR